MRANRLLIVPLALAAVLTTSRPADAHGACKPWKCTSLTCLFTCLADLHLAGSVDAISIGAVTTALGDMATTAATSSLKMSTAKATVQGIQRGGSDALASDKPIPEYTMTVEGEGGDSVRALSKPMGTQTEAAFGFLTKVNLNDPQNAAVVAAREFMATPQQETTQARQQQYQKHLKMYIDALLFGLALPNYVYGQAYEKYAPALASIDADAKGLKADSDLLEVMRVRIAAQDVQNQLLATLNEIAAAKLLLQSVETMRDTQARLPYSEVDPSAKASKTEKLDEEVKSPEEEKAAAAAKAKVDGKEKK
ncbi:hypothetical protein FACS1894186_7320 [Alphaproteobacteria bacterium]|nr:hypothetical protein FACS1894186_7320 [Alphaproteobacteria bacterium]